MATKLFPRVTKTHPPATPPYTDMLRAQVGPQTTRIGSLSEAVLPNGERQFCIEADTNGSTFVSERVASEFTISGTLTFNVWVLCPTGNFTGRLRARVYKLTAGGSDVESLICTADASIDVVTGGVSTLYSFTGTPTSTVLAPNERLLFRLFVVPVGGGFGSGIPSFRYDSGFVNNSGDSWIQLNENPTFKNNGTLLHLLRTTANGIGMLDALPTLGSSAFTTAVVSSQDSGTEIQWTKTPSNPVTVTDITAAAIASTSNATTYASASYTPVANRLYLLGVVHSDAAPESTVPTVTTTNGLAFVQVGSSLPLSTIASPGLRLTLFRAMKASGLSAGTHTVTLADAGTGCAAILAEVTGVVTTGTDGADAVINVSTNSADASANPSVTLGAFANANNGAWACFGANSQTAPTIGTGWNALGHPDYATPAAGVFAEWRANNDTSADCVLASGAWAGIAVELVAASVDGTVAEWITGRMKAPGWTVVSQANIRGALWALESNQLMNGCIREKVFRRKPDGTELLVYTRDAPPELPLSAANQFSGAGTGTLAQVTSFAEDDRLVVRVYLIPLIAQTMAGGYTGTLNYDHNALAVNGNSRIELLDSPEFKDEADPAGGETPSKMTLGGAGS